MEASRRTPTRRLLADRLARWVVTAGGMAIIASILGILVFILIEVFPLASRARVTAGASVPLLAPAAAILGDEHRTHAAVLSNDGCIRVYSMEDGSVVGTLSFKRGQVLARDFSKKSPGPRLDPF